MRQALVASVWGTVFVALAFVVLMFSQSGPVGAQETDPLAGKTANITATYIGITVAGCEADPNATASLTIADAGGDEETFTEGANADFQFGSEGITITPQGGFGDLAGDDTGTVVSSEGITCGNATGGNGGNGGAGGTGGGDNENGASTAAELQYKVIIETIPNKLVLANTGGWPILAGAALMLVASVIVGARVIGRR